MPATDIATDDETPVTEVSVTDILRDEGTVVVFSGITNDDASREVTFALSHRYAQAIANALASGFDVNVELEGWQILGSR